jgi:hypothetical protein
LNAPGDTWRMARLCFHRVTASESAPSLRSLGKSGDRRDIPHFSFYAAKLKLSCWASRTRFLGRPVFRGIRARKVECSKSATNFSDPSGLLVWVYCRRGGQTAGRFSGREMLPPFCHHPALPPALHLQRSLGSAASAVRRSARPPPLRRLRHHTRAHRIQLHITQRPPQMSFIERTRIKATLPHMPA